MRYRALLTAIAISGLSGGAAAQSRPYAGQETRAIKALSQQRVDGYLSGAGLGYAKAAELNHYPGPKHVLELAEELELSEEQRQRTAALFQGVKTVASKLGREIVDAERELDQLFARAEIAPADLDRRLDEIGRLEARLRGVHLKAHIKQRALLTADQISRYDELRGYAR